MHIYRMCAYAYLSYMYACVCVRMHITYAYVYVCISIVCIRMHDISIKCACCAYMHVLELINSMERVRAPSYYADYYTQAIKLHEYYVLDIKEKKK